VEESEQISPEEKARRDKLVTEALINSLKKDFKRQLMEAAREGAILRKKAVAKKKKLRSIANKSRNINRRKNRR